MRWLKSLRLPRRKPRLNLALFKESPKVDYLLFFKGVLNAQDSLQSVTVQPKIHQFTLKRINRRSDLSIVLPFSSSQIKALYAAQTSTKRKIVFSRFLGLQFEDSGNFYKLAYSLTHTLEFGYWLNSETFLQMLKLSFNINPLAQILKPKDGDKLAIDTACFLVNQIEAYEAKIVDGKLLQHPDLTALSAENRLMWFSMLLEEQQFRQNGNRL
jgi:hypothetical protein